MSSAEQGVWVHAVTRDIEPARLAGMTGVGGGPVRPVRAGGLAAVVSTVDLAEYGAEPLRRNLEDMSWLESVARAHHGVIDAVARLGPVVPARLATVYLDDERVAGTLVEHRRAVADALDRVSGRVEWGVKAYAAPAAANPAGSPGAGARGAARAGAGGAGRAYLLRRRAQLTATEDAERTAAEDADRLHGTLRRVAAEVRRHPPQDGRLSGRSEWMVLNGAYLVDAEHADEFAESVRGLAPDHPGIRVELTGPWPPYSFTELNLSEPEAAAGVGG
ncbi:GvpL/GvpF family gas vesicle protein [Plantactinospora siamensis]|uniref:GvpL/GvpF family gas vesicle protein n=1 Tax=Plantactinospora siamensis TaxID=555372 RepID=A0ABV6NWY3_9ACTN